MKYNKKTNVQLQKALNKFVQPERGVSSSSGQRQDDVWNEEGILKQIELKYIKSDGWIVIVDNTPYRCTYTSNIMEIPEGIQKNGYLVPTKNIKVKVSLDKISREYNIISIIDDTPQNILQTGTISLEKDNGYLVVGSGNSEIAYNENKISIDDNSVDIVGSTIKFNGEPLEDSILKAVDDFKKENGL